MVAHAEQVTRAYKQVALVRLEMPMTHRLTLASTSVVVDKAKKPVGAQRFPLKNDLANPWSQLRKTGLEGGWKTWLSTPDLVDVMFFRLRDMGFLNPVEPNEMNPNSIGYNPKAVCHYYFRDLGHDTKDSIVLKFRIYWIITSLPLGHQQMFQASNKIRYENAWTPSTLTMDPKHQNLPKMRLTLSHDLEELLPTSKC